MLDTDSTVSIIGVLLYVLIFGNMNSYLFFFRISLFVSSHMLFQWTLETLVKILKKHHRECYMRCIHLINTFWKFNIFTIVSISNQKDIFMFAKLTNLSKNFYFSSCTCAYLLFKFTSNCFITFTESMDEMH